MEEVTSRCGAEDDFNLLHGFHCPRLDKVLCKLCLSKTLDRCNLASGWSGISKEEMVEELYDHKDVESP